MKIAICDNDPLFAEEFKKQLTGVLSSFGAHLNIFIYDELAPILDENAGGADIIFMDLEWHSHVNGIDIAEALYQHQIGAKIVYVTGYIDRFVQQIYLKQTNVAGILIKPVDSYLLGQLLDKIMRDLHSSQKEDFVIHQNGQAIRLTQRQVDYIESRNHVLEIVTDDRVYRVYQPMQSLLPLLPDCFIRCHRSYIVNMNKIKHLGRQEMLMEHGERIPIGRMYRNTVKQAFIDWVSQGI